jgi:transposase InsO family protein
VERDCYGFHRGTAKDSVRLRFHLGNCGPTNQGGSLYTCQDHLLRAATSIIVYVKDSLSAWSAKKIVSDRGTQFTSRFWERLHEALDTQLHFSSAYHP